MATYSASVKALLTLDATKFDDGITKALNSVEKLVTGFNSIKKNSSGLVEGLRLLRDNMNTLSESVNRLKVSMEQAKVFNTVATAIEKIVNSARKLSEANISLSGMYQNLQNVVTLFANALSQTEIKLKGNVQLTRQDAESMNTLNSSVSRTSSSINRLNSTMSSTSGSMSSVNASMSSTTSSVNKATSNLDKLGYEFTETSSKASSFASTYKLSMAQIGESSVGFDKAYNDLMKLTRGVEQFNLISAKPNGNIGSLGNGYATYLSNLNQINSALNKSSESMNKSSESTRRFSQSLTTASNNSSTAKQRFNGLTQSLGALRTMVSMVGSMFLYNFAFNLMTSVQNTIKAKSEMQSFLHTMGMTGGQIDSFNSALDRTAERFQRINKYNIGETVANIGLEFNLSAQEMEKAMSVTSMVTSEYLRAGRNADEAALAVKDIMQGQFQRLSRETGVKGEQLKEAGWSGDVNDVMGLMDALEKVGKARHWDVFAEKASSLNDIILITQNRLSEFATDLTEGFTPIITEGFNILLNGVDRLSSLFEKLGGALNLPDWTGTALMITGLGVAIGGLITTTITWRTGLGLLDIAHKGLGQSIVATIFNIKAEEMANASATQVLKAKILGLEAEKVAQVGVKGALAESMVLEQAEMMRKEATMGAIVGKTTSLEAEYLAQEQGITVQQARVLLEEKEQLMNMRTSQVLLAKILGLDMEAVANEGVTATIGRKIAQRLAHIGVMKEETAVEMELRTAQMLSIATMGAVAIAIAALVAAIAPLIIQTNALQQNLTKFNELVKDGDNIIKDARSTVDNYAQKVASLREELGKTEKGSARYYDIQRQLNTAIQEQTQANVNLEQTIKAVEQARSRQASFEQQKTELAIQGQDKLARKLFESGVEWDTAREKAAEYYSVLNDGVGTLNDIAGFIAYNNERMSASADKIGHQFEGKESPEEISRRIQKDANIYKRMNENYEKMNTATGFADRLDGWLGFEATHVEKWISDFNNAIDAGDWDSINGHIMDALNVVMPFDEIWDLTSPIGEGISQFFGGIGDGIKSFIDDFKLPSLEELFGNWFGGDGQSAGPFVRMRINPLQWLTSLFGNIDASGVSEWFNNTIVTPLTEFFTSFSLDDLFATLTGGSLFSEGGGIIGKLLGWDENTNIGEMLSLQLDLAINSITTFANVLINQFMMLPVNIVTFLTQIISSITSFASQLLSQGIQAGSNFLNGVVTHISQLPSRVYSFITTTASNIMNGASLWVSYASQKATMMVNKVRAIVSELPQRVYEEFMKIAQRIRDAISGAVQAATQFGSDVVNAVLNALHIHSPGIIQEKIATEFADIGGRIAENIPNVSQQAETFGQGIVDGMGTQLPIVQQQAQAITDAMNVSANSQAIDFSGQFVGDYQADANTITGLNQVMTTDTATTFGLMGDTVNNTINGISMNLQTSYLNMNTSQTTALTTMQNQNKTAYTNLQNQTTSSLNNMRNTTQNVTVQMTNAWNHMKDNIIASANQLKTQSTAHFNTLSNHIGSFYRKLQNPSMWGGGDDVPTRHYNSSRGKRGIQAVRQTFGITPPRKGVAGSPDLDNLPKYMKLKQLRAMMGGSSASIFDGMDLNREVNVQEFLSQFEGGFGWNDWHPTHFGKIKNTSGEWKMRGPQIMHRIDTGESFQVKEFYNSQPQISFSSFQHMAEALFSAIPYEFYYNSDAHGSWQGALQAGSCNCYDGANALIALAATCGFSGHMEHGTWNGIPHVYAVINGKKMDTTGWQNRRDWNGVSAGSPPNYKPTSSGDKVTNVNIDMSGTTFYGMDDFEGRMEEIAQRVLGEEVNTSITLGI